MFVPVAEYMPDQPDLQNPGSGYVRNCLPRTAQSYGPMPSLAAYSNGLTARCQGAFACQDADKVVLFRRLKPGTSLVREHQGVRHIVTITESGFVWRGRTYDSLSAIAREITGSRWNGPRFFGLRPADKADPARKAS